MSTSFLWGTVKSLTDRLFSKETDFEQSFSPFDWRQKHNYFLDRGMKFMVVYKSPEVVSTDLFDLERFGCVTTRTGSSTKLLRTLDKFTGQRKNKQWWDHPSFVLGSRFKRIGVRLQDLTSGELKWDAIYNIGDAQWKHAPGENDDGAACRDGKHLCEEEEPIGGSHPFFQPDWCPGPTDGVSHKYHLEIKNLGQVDQPSQPLVGEMFFTQYPMSKLENTYSYETLAPVEKSLF